MDRKSQLNDLIRRVLDYRPPVGEYPELFLGNWCCPEVLFIGITPTTTGIRPDFSSVDALRDSYTNYFSRIETCEEEKRIWARYKAFDDSALSGADWLKQRRACITNFYIWAVNDVDEVTGGGRYVRLVEQHSWNFVKEFLAIAQPTKIVIHGSPAYTWLHRLGSLPPTYKDARECEQPVANVPSDWPLRKVAVSHYIGFFGPTEQVVRYVRG